MKLTVGPLPPAVYWRRRVAVAGALLLLVTGLFYACSGRSGDRPGRNAKQPGGVTSSPTAASSASAAAPASASPPAVVPAGGFPAQGGDGGDQQPEGAAGSEPPAAPSAPCTDAEIAVTAVTETATVPRNSFVRFTLRIKNTSNRSCTRDVGADAQELYLQDAAKNKVWSSDTCDARTGTDVRTFGPGIETEFWQLWDGKASNAGCVDRKAPPAGRYELVGRLASKLSDPVAIELK
ncbi:hypothetical protein ACNTMW_16655 [Planosporangium sp. 12N6]|uniref:hypothetical protein n=1 Tax=Planosporangium spinosum TaxID=3402278 RepID=UPI003CF5AED3